MVVQVPRDQIYRVPPPENASIAESYRNQDKKEKKVRICGCSVASCIGVLAAISVFIGVAVGLSVMILKTKHYEFTIQQLVVKINPVSDQHSKKPPPLPDYHITLNIQNPDEESSISYKPGGVTWLYFGQHKIATGKFPAFHQKPKNTTRITLPLKGSKKATLPMEGAKPEDNSLKLSLDMEVPIRTQLKATKAGDAKLKVACNFTVDKLAGVARILSQDCKTDILSSDP